MTTRSGNSSTELMTETLRSLQLEELDPVPDMLEEALDAKIHKAFATI